MLGSALYLRYSETMTKLVRELIERLGLNYIDPQRVAVVINKRSRSTAYARIYGLPKQFQVAFNLRPLYVIEIVHRNFKKLSCRDKLRVLIHELMHIPQSFSGGLRHHGTRFLSDSHTNLLLRRIDIATFCAYLDEI